MCVVFAAVGLDNLITRLLEKFCDRGLVALPGSLVCLRSVARAPYYPVPSFAITLLAGSLEHRRRNRGGHQGHVPPLGKHLPFSAPPFKLSNLVFNLQRCWKARVRAPVKWSAYAIYLCLPPPNARLQF